jgi:AcrR family transcriptional regulator
VPRTGRRKGTSGTRERILTAARSHFGSSGFDGATIRNIAAVAGVDPALIPHYFGSKEGVFKAAVEFPVDPSEFIPRLLAPGINGLGERLALFFLETWDSPAGASLLGLIRSVVSSELAADLMREFVTREVLGRLAAAIKIDHPQLRASLVATQLVGLAMLRYVIRVHAIKNASRKELARWIGPNIQRYLTEPVTP